MSPVAFEVLGVRVETYAAVPTLMFRLRITAADDTPVHAIILRSQIMIEPQRRRYSSDEEARLNELFGNAPRWGDTLRPFLWTNLATTVTGFTGSTEVDLPVTCTYDFEIASVKYMHSLEGGEIPIVALFSGTVFAKSPVQGSPAQGMSVSPVSWSEEASFRLPVGVWREMMDLYFPDTAWLRLQRETLDALQHYKVQRALRTWDETFELLLKEAGEDA